MSKPPRVPSSPERSDVPDSGTSRAATDRRVRRRAISERARLGGSEKPKKSPRAMAVSVLLHLGVATIMLQLLTFGHGLSSFLDFAKTKNQKEERITFVATDPPKPKITVAVKPVTKPQPSAPDFAPLLTAPSSVPQGTPTTTAARTDTGSGARPTGAGNGVGAVDPDLRGVKPDYNDPRIWQAPTGNTVAPSRTGSERLDSVMGYAIGMARDSLDSLARAQGKYDRKPGDWTKTDKNGNKWGWDGTGIRLGKMVIPNALLALLPMNAQKGMSGNSIEFDRERRLALARTDIQRMSEQTLGDREFKQLASELRDRRERERRDRLKAPSATIAPAPVVTPPDKK